MDYRDFYKKNTICFEINESSDKGWEGSHDEIIQLWRNSQNVPQLYPRTIPANYRGRRFGNDGIRVTGSANFINSVLARIKDLLAYDERSNTKLDIEYRQIIRKKNVLNAVPEYVCYIYVVERK